MSEIEQEGDLEMDTVQLKELQIVVTRIEDMSPEDLYATDEDTNPDEPAGRSMLPQPTTNGLCQAILAGTDDSETEHENDDDSDSEMSSFSEDDSDDQDFGEAKSKLIRRRKINLKREVDTNLRDVKKQGRTRKYVKGRTTAIRYQEHRQRILTEVLPPFPTKAERTCTHPGCGTTFYSLVKLGEHARTHGIEKPFRCAVCSTDFATIAEIDSHKINHHGLRRELKPTAAEVRKRREIQIPWTSADILCHYCGKKWDTVQELRDHTRVHTRNPPNNICSVCKFNCKHPKSLWHHFEQCHLGFKHTGSQKKIREALKDSTELPAHVQKAPFVTCDICGKVYWFLWRLDAHKSRAHGLRTGCIGKPLACVECGLSFQSPSYLDKHLRSKRHRPEKSFVCETCGRGFREMKGMRNHIAKFHPEVEMPRRYEYGTAELVPSVFDGITFDERAEDIVTEGEVSNEPVVPKPCTSTETAAVPADPPTLPPPAPSSFELGNMDPFQLLQFEPKSVSIRDETSQIFEDDLPLQDGGDDILRNDANPASNSDPEQKVDTERLDRLRRACKRRSMNYTLEYHDVPVKVKIEEGESHWSGEEWTPDEAGTLEENTTKANTMQENPVLNKTFRGRRKENPVQGKIIPERNWVMKGRLRRRKPALRKSHSATPLSRTTRQPSSEPISRRLEVLRLLESKRRHSSCSALKPKKRRRDTKVKCRLGGCTFRARDNDELNDHRRTIHGREDGVRTFNFKCDFPECTFRARFAESLESHRVTHSSEAEAEKIPVSNKEIRTVSQPKKYTYPCTYHGCSKGFSHRLRLVAHVENFHKLGIPLGARKIHVIEKPERKGYNHPYRAVCHLQGCKFVVHSRIELVSHRREVHGAAFAHKLIKARQKSKYNWIYCGISSCSYRALLAENMATHKTKVHDQLPPIPNFTCPHCDKVFSSNSYRMIHVKLKHSTLPEDRVPAKIQCMYCPRKLSCRMALFGHIQSAHPNEPTFPCMMCTKIYYFKQELGVHEQLHRKHSTSAELQFKCVVKTCTEVLTSLESLREHVKGTHDGPKRPDVKTICPTCGKEFPKYKYARHWRTHTVKDPKFKCNTCGKVCMRGNLLDNHMEKEHPEKYEGHDRTFVCDICGDGFYNKGTFILHCSRKHGPRAQRRTMALPKPLRCRAKNPNAPRRKRRTKQEMIRDRAVAAAARETFGYSKEVVPPQKTVVASPAVPMPPPAHQNQSQTQFQYHQRPEESGQVHYHYFPYLQSSQVGYPHNTQVEPHYLFQ